MPSPGTTLAIVPRAGSDLSVDWVSNFDWARSSSPLWKHLAPVIENSILGWGADSVTPGFVISGFGEQNSPNDLVGVFYGWLKSHQAYLVELNQGSGRMLISTLRFEGRGTDPLQPCCSTRQSPV